MDRAQVLVVALVLLAGCGAEAEPAWTPVPDNQTSTFTPPHDQSEYREPEYPDVEKRSDINVTQVERLVIDEINYERGSRRLSTVVEDERLSNIGRNYSMTMGKHGFFSHTGWNGESFDDRMRTHEYHCPNGREILVKTAYDVPVESSQGGLTNITTKSDLAVEITKLWMSSTEHKKAILLEGATTIGIGVHVTPDGTVYATGIICTEQGR